MAAIKKAAAKKSVDNVKHQDKRKNIPTEELREFMDDEEEAPKTMLYPRDPTLDPQLVWKGKDEQDQQDLEVPVVPVYIQEKIHPRALIEDLRAASSREGDQLNLFADFNGIDSFEKQTAFYQHEQSWTNRMILGDSLLVMTSLAEKEGLKGKVQMIYLDPPYGIKFGSNWQVSTRKRDVRDGRAEDATRQPEQVKAFRDTWELGVHSYLSYLRDRFVSARELLTESGSIFVQIGDENVHLVRAMLDEVFHSENFCGQIAFFKTTSQTSSLSASTIDYLLWYGKNRNQTKYRQMYLEKSIETDRARVYTWIELVDGSRRRLTTEEKSAGTLPDSAKIFRLDTMTSQSGGATTGFAVAINGRAYTPGKGFWKTNQPGMEKLIAARRVTPSGTTLAYVRYIQDFAAYPLANLWTDTGTGSFTDPKVYVVQTGSKVTQRCVLMTTDPGDLVLDPTCGSGTTAYVAEQWGRRWITIDTSRVALALARTRLMSARYPNYVLADSPEGVKKEGEITGTAAPPAETGKDVRKGFVYKRVPHVTLKSIANNPDIKEGMSREEIDRAIARHADEELLYDQPYEDSKKVRVAGPFTVESLSPHRLLDEREEAPQSQRDADADPAGGQFDLMVIDNLRKSGVQNTRKEERLKFERLEPYASPWLHAEGEFTDSTGLTRRVAVSVGPQYGTVGADQIKEAAKEATRGVGFDLLVVCGFAFDAHAGETAKEFQPDDLPREGLAIVEETRQYGKLPIMLARMNPDLGMSDELLKKTGAGNLFMVFGEPDLEIRTIGADGGGDTGTEGSSASGATSPPGPLSARGEGESAKGEGGQLVVEIRGLDVYDPTTGVVRSSSTDDIACWFIDTNYNEESFFVRHAYFTGADQPYEKLRKVLRAEIDEDAWASLYSTVSRPFDRPETGKIAVKVINHYGDEVLKVYEV